MALQRHRYFVGVCGLRVVYVPCYPVFHLRLDCVQIALNFVKDLVSVRDFHLANLIVWPLRHYLDYVSVTNGPL